MTPLGASSAWSASTRAGVRAEVDDVVEGAGGQRRQVGGLHDAVDARSGRRAGTQLGHEGLALGVVGQQRRHGLRGRRGDQLGQALDGVAGVRHDQESSAGRQAARSSVA